MPKLRKKKPFTSFFSDEKLVKDESLFSDIASHYEDDIASEPSSSSGQKNISNGYKHFLNKLGQHMPEWIEFHQKGYNTVEIKPDLSTLKTLEDMIPELLQEAPEALRPVIDQIRKAVQTLSDSLNNDWDKKTMQEQNREDLTRRMALDASLGGGVTRQNLLTFSEMAKSVNQLLMQLMTILAKLKAIVTIMDLTIPEKIKATLAENLLTELKESASDSVSVAEAEQEVNAMLFGTASPEINEMFTALVTTVAEDVTTSLARQLSMTSEIIKSVADNAKFQARRISERANKKTTDIAIALTKVSDSLNLADETVRTLKRTVSPSSSMSNRLIKNAKKVPGGIKTGAEKLGRILMSGAEILGQSGPDKLSGVLFIPSYSPERKEEKEDLLWIIRQALSYKIKHKLSYARQAVSKAKYQFTQFIAPDMPETTEFSAQLRVLSLPLLAEAQKLFVAAGQLEITLRTAIKPEKQRVNGGSVSAKRGKKEQRTLEGLLEAAQESISASANATALSQQSRQQLLSALNASAKKAHQTAEDVKKAVDEDKFIAEMVTELQRVPAYPGFLRNQATALLDRFAPAFKKIVRDLTDTAELL